MTSNTLRAAPAAALTSALDTRSRAGGCDKRPLAHATVLAATACALLFGLHASQSVAQSASKRLPGHAYTLPQNEQVLPGRPEADQEPMSLTVTLQMPKSAAFEAFKRNFHEPTSPDFHKPIPVAEFTARFGPSQADYDAVRAHFEGLGFQVGTTSNRRTLTVSGTRGLVQKALQVRVADVQRGSERVHATLDDPAVPAELVPVIELIDGLNTTAKSHPMFGPPTPATLQSIAQSYNNFGFPQLNGRGQTIALLEYADYVQSDLTNWLAWAGLPAAMANQVHRTYWPSAATLPTSLEVIGDIDAVLSGAPGANVAVVVVNGNDPNASYTGTYQALISAAQGNGTSGGIISISWGSCEGNSAWAINVQNTVNDLLSTAEYSGLSVFAAAGDHGAEGDPGCLVPSLPNVEFPADLPAVIAVGGTFLATQGTSNAYNSEQYWDASPGSWGGSAGGFGVSQTQTSPQWQGTFTTSTMRSVPDVAAAASAYDAIAVCYGYNGSTPACGGGNILGGTSQASPTWAATWALVSQAAGVVITANLGHLYYLASAPYLMIPGTNGCAYLFHSPGCMQGPDNDFQHVGLGSPNVSNLISYLSAKPYIASLSPNSGLITNAPTVTATGFFPWGAEFWFDAFPIQGLYGTEATNTTCPSIASCTFTPPLPAPYLGANSVTPFSSSASPPQPPSNSAYQGWWGETNPAISFSYNLPPHLPPPPCIPYYKCHPGL